MGNYFFILILLLFWKPLNAQSIEPSKSTYEQQLESLAEKQDAETEDDSYWQQLDEYRKHPINLNLADETDLSDLKMLTGLQVKNFIHYRELLGKLVSIYEVQAIPTWDIETIRQLLPYISVSEPISVKEIFRKRLKGGENNILLRVSQQLEKSNGFEKPADSSTTYYLGSRQRILVRYKYNYKNLLQYGILGDKDAGEQFFRGNQKYGFDFYSFHFYAKKIGIIKSLAIGDFTVNMGQGLIQWQSLAFSKSSDVLAVKRQSSVLRPYNSAGEFNFHRGAGITLQKGHWEATVFGSFKNISANLVPDSSNKGDFISSFLNSGYHRTAGENADRNSTRQVAIGGSLDFSNYTYHIGINAIHYHFSNPVKKQEQPYNLFALQGRSWLDFSTDYSYTWRNMHLFGEAARDKNGCNAFVSGALISLSSSVDAALLYRKIDKGYQSLYADAFTENSAPSNESGLYTGISARPFSGWRMDFFFDIFRFPWLKYRVDAPSYGRDYLVQLSFQPNRQWSIYARFKNESKQMNEPATDAAVNHVVLIPRHNWRTEFKFNINHQISVSNRIELLWYDKKKKDAEEGFAGFFDFFYKPFPKPYTANIRLQYFETGGYNSRIYAFENDALYSFSLPVFYDKGFRYYINLNCRLNRLFHLRYLNEVKTEAWLRWAQTIYPGKNFIGSGLDQVHGNKKSEIKIQIFFSW